MGSISLRIDDDVLALVDQLASNSGITRSAWINRAIADSLTARPEEVREGRSYSGKSATIYLRLPVEDIDAIDSAAMQAGMNRSQWIKNTIRWQLFDTGGRLRLSPLTYRAILRVVAQVRAIGRTANQSVKAMHAANRPEASGDIERIGAELLHMKDAILAAIHDAEVAILGVIVTEADYWRGRDQDDEAGEGGA